MHAYYILYKPEKIELVFKNIYNEEIVQNAALETAGRFIFCAAEDASCLYDDSCSS